MGGNVSGNSIIVRSMGEEGKVNRLGLAKLCFTENVERNNIGEISWPNGKVMNLFESRFRGSHAIVIFLYREASGRAFPFLSTNWSTNRFSTILRSPNIPLSLARQRGESFEDGNHVSRDSISSFYLVVVYCIYDTLCRTFDWTEGNGREGKGKERKEKRKLVAGAYNRGDLIQDRGDLINIEEIFRGLGSDYSFEEIFRGETIGRAPTFPLKGRKSEVEKETLRGRREEERSGRRRMEEGIAISYFHLEDSLNMHETIAYLMQLAEANLFPSFPFQLAPVFFSPTCSSPPHSPSSRFVCFPLSSRCRRKLDSNQRAFAIFADSSTRNTRMQIKSRQFAFFHR